ncbi:hypothetical protein IF803_41560 [Bradyrhizobium sp. UFLA06-06]
MRSETAEVSAEPSDIIERFPGPIVLVPSRVKWLLMTLGSGLMTASGVFVIWIALSRSPGNAGIGLAMGIAGVLFFGTAGIVSILALQPGACSLSLNQAGFEVTNLYRTRAFYWAQVSDFGVYSTRRRQMVVFRSAKPVFSFLEQSNAWLTGGRNCALPDTYGFSATDLVRLLVAWQDLAMTRPTASNSLVGTT